MTRKNKRVHPRTDVSGIFSSILTIGDMAMTGLVLDISDGGIFFKAENVLDGGFIAPRAAGVEAGDTLTLNGTQEVKVCWVGEKGESYGFGCQYL